MGQGLLPKYRDMISSGEIEADPAQYLVIEKLQLLANRLVSYKPPSKTDLFSFFTRKIGEVPQGLYVFGGVGRGKTMLMDLFYQEVGFEAKRRVHFHEFMLEIHDAIGLARKTVEGDPIPEVAKSIADKASLICFDEFHVTNIADAMILGRLFSSLFERHVVIVATSNVEPKDLYKNGLNRDYFLPFIDLLEQHMEVLELASPKDYRIQKLDGEELYFSPLGKSSEEAMNNMFTKLTGQKSGQPRELTVKGRRLYISQAALGVARFTFEELCGNPLGAVDYLKIAHTFHTILLENVPVMGPAKRDQARRFNTLIDALYDNSTGLIMSAAALPEQLYVEGDGSFLFERTVSRLNEMKSQEYLVSKKAL